MKSAAEIESILSAYCCTEQYHYNTLSRAAEVVYTDGVKAMAELCGAYWLIELICSYQARCRQDPQEMLQDMQFWTIKVNGPDGQRMKSAVIICERDTGDVFLTQEIEATGFPLPELKLYVQAGGVGGERVMVILLPSEY